MTPTPPTLAELLVLIRAAHDARARGDVRKARELERQVNAAYVQLQWRVDERAAEQKP
jgi:hypothetical protein